MLLGQFLCRVATLQFIIHRKIGEWPERLDQIVGQVERIGHAVVMQADGRQKAGGGEGTGNTATQHGIGIVQRLVALVGLVAASEIVEQRLPVITCRTSLDVVRTLEAAYR